MAASGGVIGNGHHTHARHLRSAHRDDRLGTSFFRSVGKDSEQAISFVGLSHSLGLHAFVWCESTVMRAAIMLSLAYIAKILGWQFSSLNNLATTALILLIYRPGILFEVGPQLSFIAVAVLILSSENLTKRQTALMSLIKAREGHGMRTYRAVMAWIYSALRTSFWFGSSPCRSCGMDFMWSAP